MLCSIYQHPRWRHVDTEQGIKHESHQRQSSHHVLLIQCPSCMRQGGDVSPNSMHMLHARAGLPGSVQVVRGIAMGGFDAAKAAIRDGRAPAQDFKCARGSACPP